MEKNRIGTVVIPFFYKEQFTDVLLKSGYIVEIVKTKRIFDDDEKEKDAAIITVYEKVLNVNEIIRKSIN